MCLKPTPRYLGSNFEMEGSYPIPDDGGFEKLRTLDAMLWEKAKDIAIQFSYCTKEYNFWWKIPYINNDK